MSFSLGIRSVLPIALLMGLLSPAVSIAKMPAPKQGAKVPITTSKEEARAAFLKGRDLLEKLRFADARVQFEHAVKVDPSFGIALTNLAITQPTARQFNETIARAVAVSDQVSPGERLLILATDAAGHGDNVEQIRLLKELSDLYPDDERVQTQYGNAFFATQEWSKAIVALEAATKINPSYSQPYNQLGYSYKLLGKYDQAEAAFKKYIELIPDDPNPYDSYAELLLKLGRYQESVATYRKALALDPHFASAHYGIATNYDLMHEPAKARDQLATALSVARDDGQRRGAMFALTVSYAHAGDLAAARQEIEKQYQLSVDTRDTLNMIGDKVLLGTVALESGDVATADQAFSAARDWVEHAVTLPEANRANQRRFQEFLQGRLALAKGDLDGARRWSDDFAAQANASGSAGQKLLVHELAGQIALAQKDYAKAIAELEQANLLDPYNLYRLSLAHLGAGHAAKSREYAEKARKDNTLTNLNYAFVLRALAANKSM